MYTDLQKAINAASDYARLEKVRKDINEDTWYVIEANKSLNTDFQAMPDGHYIIVPKKYADANLSLAPEDILHDVIKEPWV